jgi:5'-3' exonuclease
MVPGWHYSWPVGDRVGEKTPYWVDDIGELQPKYHTDKFLKNGDPKLKKLEGTGMTWFYCQLITGDATDNIPGCPSAGPAKAIEALTGLSTERSMYEAVLALYEDKYPENALEELVEQAYLLWMVRELDADGQPIMWEVPNG